MPFPRRRLLSLCLLLVLAGVLTAGAGEWHRRQRRGQQLAAQVQALVARSYERPSHAEPPLPGSFRERATLLMPELLRLLEAGRKLDEATAEACKQVREGTRPLAQLPPPCREGLMRGEELVQRTLQATRAARGGMPEGLGVLDDPAHPLQTQGAMPFLQVQKLAALQLRIALDAGHAPEALDTCLDMLALAREVGSEGSLLAQMLAVSAQDIAYRGCAAALEAAPLPALQRALPALARLTTGWQSFPDTMRVESVWAGVVFESYALGESHLAALPAGARALALADYGMTGRAQHGFVDRFWRWELNRRLPAYFAKRVEAAALPAEQRDLRFRELCAQLQGSYNRLERSNDCSEFGYGRFAARIDRQRAQLALLLALAEARVVRGQTGSWPRAFGSLEAAPQLPRPGLRIVDAQHAWLEPTDPVLMDLSLELRAAVAGQTP